jgi:flagellar biosynthesis protein FlhF
MKLHKFLAPDARAGLEQIRKELGPDAVVVTSRKTAQGVEFLAGRFDELEGSASAGAAKVPASGSGNAIWRELTRLRALLQNQLAGFAWSAERRRHPVRVHVLQKMLATGFSPRLARHLAAGLPRSHSAEQADTWLRQVLIRNLQVFAPAEMPGLKPGVWALVGPTGHGKTTTLAKLAANAALRHGREKVVLISVDSYRVGAQQQLEAYARMMGVDCIGLDDVNDLPLALGNAADKSCVMIDSAGFAPNDEQFSMQMAALRQGGAACLLTLSATTQGSLMERIIQQHAKPAGVIITKLDEGGLSGQVLDCLMRYRLPLACLSTGQRVPEDLHAAHASYVVDRALRAHETGSFAMQDEDWALYAGMVADAEAERESARRSA